MDRRRTEAGQATTEVLALIAIIAVVLVAAGGIAQAAAPGITNRVLEGFQRALCIVTGQRCAAMQREPCPQTRTTQRRTARATIGYLKAGGGRTLFIERRSDGTYRLSLLEGGDAGLGATVTRGGATAEVAATLGARIGRTYRADTPAQAQALAEQLRRPGLPTVDTLISGARDLAGLADADPTVDEYVLAGQGGLDALESLDLNGWLGGSVLADHQRQLGVRIAAHRREATVYLDLQGHAKAAFSALSNPSLTLRKRGSSPATSAPSKGGVDLTKPSGGPAKQPSQTFRFNNPSPIAREARAVASGHVAVTLGPGGRVVGIELVGSYGAGSTLHELRARIDPDAPGLTDALRAWRRDPLDPAALRAIGHAAAESSALDRRTFAYRADDSRKGKLAGSLRGLGLGFTIDGLNETAELIEQQSRPIGGLWEARIDCSLSR